MDLKIANRLFEYRKKAGLSQDQLADKIGVSRQAVSKWERGEASPDTENLIVLAEIYDITLDELVKGEKISSAEKLGKDSNQSNKTYISFKDGVLSVKDGKKEQEVHINYDGVHINVPKTNVHINSNFLKNRGHIFGNIIKRNKVQNFFNNFPYPILTIIAYLLFGSFNFCGGWAYGWLVFLTIPLYYTLINAIQERNASSFAYPVLVVLVYLILGFYMKLWHPMWLLFLTIPFYYFICEFIKKL